MYPTKLCIHPSRLFYKDERKLSFVKDKKPPFKKKIARGSRLSQEDFEKENKENLWFISLFPNHPQWKLPRNKKKGEEEKVKVLSKERETNSCSANTLVQ